MNVRRIEFGTRWWWVIAGAAVVALVVTLVQRLDTSPTTTATPICSAHQLVLTLGSPHREAGGRQVDTDLLARNGGSRCQLLDDAPEVQMVRGPSHRSLGLGDVVSPQAHPPLTLAHGAEATSVVAVTVLPPELRRTCDPEDATGLVVRVGLPRRRTHYFARRFTGVCSNRLRANVGALWWTAVTPAAG